MPGRQGIITVIPERFTSKPFTIVLIIRPVTLSLDLIRIRTTVVEATSFEVRRLTGWSATGPVPATAKPVLLKFSVRNWATTAIIMSGNLFRAILLLLQQMIVTLITHHIPVQRLEVPERASPIILRAFQTTSLNMVSSRPNHLQL